MMVIGLTGGIGSGKTTVSGLFEDLGVPVYNSDEEAKRLMQSSEKLKRAIIKLLGKKSYKKDTLNRSYIAQLVFNDKELLAALNALVHPAVKKDFKKWLRKKNVPYVIQEAAILFENGSYKEYDKLILVKAPKRIRLKRLKARDGSSEEDILARMKNQWSDTKKAKLSDFVIENIDLDKTKSRVRRIHRQLIKTKP
jgi:dephospho-CoA kinase